MTFVHEDEIEEAELDLRYSMEQDQDELDAESSASNVPWFGMIVVDGLIAALLLKAINHWTSGWLFDSFLGPALALLISALLIVSALKKST